MIQVVAVEERLGEPARAAGDAGPAEAPSRAKVTAVPAIT
jgi:hypothetical protein